MRGVLQSEGRVAVHTIATLSVFWRPITENPLLLNTLFSSADFSFTARLSQGRKQHVDHTVAQVPYPVLDDL